MPNFKPKATKKIKFNKKASVTLDSKHREFLNEFSKDEHNKIPELKAERQEIIDKLTNEIDTLSLEQQLDMSDQIKELTDAIKNIKRKKKEYFLDNSKHIFDYFETKKKISSGNNCSVVSDKTKMLNSFFKIQSTEQDQGHPHENSNNIVKQYLSNIDESFLDVNSFICQTGICKYCHKGELISVEDEGILVCNSSSCSRTIACLIENEKPSYKEPPKEVCFYMYRRINHFKEIIAQVQGKQTTQIPPDVIESIKLQIKKERADITKMSNLQFKEILKKLGLNKYYEHIPFIKNIFGIKPPVMSPALEETLFSLFTELQAPYSTILNNINRSNFLNYHYSAFKLCELLDERKYLEHFQMLKDDEKIMEQDDIWKKLCIQLDWEFIQTIV
jgi:hypothetical protein